MIEVKTSFGEVLEQHRDIEGTIEKLKQFLEQPRPEIGVKGSHTWANQLAADLLVLHDKIFRHFREEEKSGFLEEITLREPQAIRTVETLRRDHDRILSELRELMSSAIVYSEEKMPESPRLRKWTLSLLDRLAQHEYEETELFQKVQYLDHGVGD
jgi:hypothetical protein